MAKPKNLVKNLKIPFLQEHYLSLLLDLKTELMCRSSMQVPRLSKVIVSMGLGEAIQNKKVLDSAMQQITQITGQKAIKTKAKHSIAGFKLRQGQEIGLKVTLRRKHMYEFLERLIHIALPRVRDFRGLNPKSFDGQGNYTLGIKENIIFPEINYDTIDKIRGLKVTVVTSTNSDKEALIFLKKMGFPFR